jgi:hypothetical protein
MSVAHEVAWAAGFFDGEGYVTIQHGYTKAKNGKQYPRHTLRIGINHVAPEPLYEMQRLFGGSIEKQKLSSVVGNRKPRHRWVLNCSKAAEALTRMMPYFKNKQQVAELGLELQATMQNNKQTVSDDVLLLRAMLKEKITHLNSLD